FLRGRPASVEQNPPTVTDQVPSPAQPAPGASAQSPRASQPAPAPSPVGSSSARNLPQVTVPSGVSAPSTVTKTGDVVAGNTPKAGGTSIGGAIGAAMAGKIHLRSEKQTLTGDEAKALVFSHNYFHAYWNSHGTGI